MLLSRSYAGRSESHNDHECHLGCKSNPSSSNVRVGGSGTCVRFRLGGNINRLEILVTRRPLHARLARGLALEDVVQAASEGDSHFEFGYELGKTFKHKIQERFNQTDEFQNSLLSYYHTPSGQIYYHEFLKTHHERYPDYMEELQGIAQGSLIPFYKIFLMNIIQEYGNCAQNFTIPALHCSDVVLRTNDLCLVGHNEDSGVSDVNHTAIVIAKIKQNPKFIAFTYLGDLPTGAFGFNANGIAFTLNHVQPSEYLIGGIGRGFVSRDLLHATSIIDCLRRVTISGQSSGHNYQLMDIHAKRVLNVEVASFDRYSVREFYPNDPPFFHANQYQTLNVHQPEYASSVHRLARYAEIPPPKTMQDLLNILGDQHDKSYPVFHDTLSHANGNLSGWTMTTIIFDLLQKKASLLSGNPKLAIVSIEFDLDNLTLTVG